ncbi:hypothetical protein M4D49_27300 [Cupriavidus pauculus]|uniref:hypothetical protein n=1 Tax=Cupriavidus pauculus TaxID=82633 RepID=UPI00203B2B06|nr:hypothetical protein [Cupriavidus pauculus]MCM3609196.1 hypothetical protein [Cupriavidus pauculus]
MSVAFGHEADDHYQEQPSRLWDLRRYAVGLFEGLLMAQARIEGTMATVDELRQSAKARSEGTAVLRYCVSATFGPDRDSREFGSAYEAARAFHEMDAKDYPRVIVTDGSFARTVADCASKGTGNDLVAWKYAASSDPVFHAAYSRVVAADKIAQATEDLARRRASHTGSWWEASVLRKEAIALDALNRAIDQGETHVDLCAALEGTSSFDTEAERLDCKERDLAALGRLSAVLRAVKDLGVGVTSPMDEPGQANKAGAELAAMAEALGFSSIQAMEAAQASDLVRDSQHAAARAYQSSPDAVTRRQAAAERAGIESAQIVWVQPGDGDLRPSVANQTAEDTVAASQQTASINDLDPAQRVALIAFRAQHGRNWKQKLLDGWLRAAYPGHLQAIRNQFGPEWLAEVKDVPTYRLNVVLTSADGCEGTFFVSLNGRGAAIRESAIVWTPREPDEHTVSAAFRRYTGDELQAEYAADGDFWRAIEDSDLEDDLYESMLTGSPLAEAVEAVPVHGSRPGM